MQRLVVFSLLLLIVADATAQRIDKYFFKRPNQNGTLYFAIPIECKVDNKDVKEFSVDFTYSYRRDSVQPYALMNFTIVQKLPIMKFAKVGFVENGLYFFSTDSVDRFYCDAVPGGWQNRHSIFFDVTYMMKLFSDTKNRKIKMEYDGKTIVVTMPKKYFRRGKLMALSLQVETGKTPAP